MSNQQLGNRGHRRKPSGSGGRLLPQAIWPAVRDPGRERPDRRCLAEEVGFLEEHRHAEEPSLQPTSTDASGVWVFSMKEIEQAPFLTAEQKRDILYHKAVRFLRLEQDASRTQPKEE